MASDASRENERGVREPARAGLRRPDVVAFDLLGTVFSLDRLRSPLVAAGLSGDKVELWITSTLRDGFGLAAAGRFAPFRDVAKSNLETLLTAHGATLQNERVERVLDAVKNLDAHPDARAAFQRARDAGLRVVTVSNGGVDGSRALLERAELTDLVDAVHGVDEVQRWKPAPDPYLHVARAHGVPPDRVALVAVHAWDVMGAHAAGLVTGWANRDGATFPRALGEPDVTGRDLTEVVDALLALPATTSAPEREAAR